MRAPKGECNARQTLIMSPAPNQMFQSKIQYKNSSHKQYLPTRRNIFRLWNHRNLGRGKRKGSCLGRKTFGMLGTRSTRNIIYDKGRIGRNRNWIRSRWIRMVRGDRGQVPVILRTSYRSRNEMRIRNRVSGTGSQEQDQVEQEQEQWVKDEAGPQPAYTHGPYDRAACSAGTSPRGDRSGADDRIFYK